MKKSPKLLSLSRFNTKLKHESWANYLGFLESVCRSTDHECAREFLGRISSKDYTGLLDLADHYASAVLRTPAEHRLVNQLCALVRKYPFPQDLVKTDPRGKALETFLKSERKCSRVNKRFKLFDSLRSPYEKDLQISRSWISYVLGDLSLKDIWDECTFGPGASIGIHGNATNDARKLLASRWSVTPGAFYYARAAMMTDNLFMELLNTAPGSQFYSHSPTLFNERFGDRTCMVDHNKIAFVPKTVKTERTIAVEPLLNGYVQKGIDVFLRKRLKRVGIDLEDQSLNQGLARFGSIQDLDADPYVTIDLSSASDSISIGLCRNLLPPDWFDFLNQIRSKHYLIEGRIAPYEKFVSMGNGFCFPLETLIFASLCHVAYREISKPDDFSVYGDDIIVRRSVADRVLSLLQVCGFEANRNKTFIQGPFRESCGADWFNGEDVRPITLDFAFDSLESIFKFCNIAGQKPSIKAILEEGVDFLRSLVPHSLNFVRPYKGQPDSAFEVPIDEFMLSPFSRYNRELQSWSWLELVHKPVRDSSVRAITGYNVALMRGALRGVSSSSPFTFRRKTSTKLRRVSYNGGWSLYLPGVLFSRQGDHPLPL